MTYVVYKTLKRKIRGFITSHIIWKARHLGRNQRAAPTWGCHISRTKTCLTFCTCSRLQIVKEAFRKPKNDTLNMSFTKESKSNINISLLQNLRAMNLGGEIATWCHSNKWDSECLLALLRSAHHTVRMKRKSTIEGLNERFYERTNGTLYTTVHSRTLCVIKIGVLRVNLMHYLKCT